MYFRKRVTSGRFETSYIPTHFDLLITNMTMKIDANDIFKVNPKTPHFSRYSYYLNKYWFEGKMFHAKPVVYKNGVSSYPVIGWLTEY